MIGAKLKLDFSGADCAIVQIAELAVERLNSLALMMPHTPRKLVRLSGGSSNDALQTLEDWNRILASTSLSPPAP